MSPKILPLSWLGSSEALEVTLAPGLNAGAPALKDAFEKVNPFDALGTNEAPLALKSLLEGVKEGAATLKLPIEPLGLKIDEVGENTAAFPNVFD